MKSLANEDLFSGGWIEGSHFLNNSLFNNAFLTGEEVLLLCVSIMFICCGHLYLRSLVSQIV